MTWSMRRPATSVFDDSFNPAVFNYAGYFLTIDDLVNDSEVWYEYNSATGQFYRTLKADVITACDRTLDVDPADNIPDYTSSGGDGRLDVDEDIDGDGKLDTVNEKDIDGDLKVDTVNEVDTDGSGAWDPFVLADDVDMDGNQDVNEDLNGDGDLWFDVNEDIDGDCNLDVLPVL